MSAAVSLSIQLRRYVLAGTCVAAALLSTACQKAQDSAPSFKAIDITGADYAKELGMTDVDGKRRTLADFAGKVVVVFFGCRERDSGCR